MSRIEARGISIFRGGRAILEDVSFTAEAGELVVMIGPNGAGKSTLLSTLAGLLRPDRGHMAIDGVPLAQMPRTVLARRRAFLPQNPQLEWPISVARLVALGLTPHLPSFGGLPPAMQDAVGRALDAFDLAPLRDQPATTLSGGEFARAMLARATVATPDILIVDEPVTGLDPRHAIDSMLRLKAYAAAGGLVIASLHDLTLAARHASRIVALKHGRVAGEGPLTPALIHRLFDIEARVQGEGENVTVDFQAS